MTRRFDDFATRLEGRAADKGKPGDEPEAPPTTPPATPDTPSTPGEPSGEPAPEDQIEEDQDMPNDTPLEEREDFKAAISAARDAGHKAATDRMNAVFAHENCKGREAHAVRLLGRSSMSAEDIAEELAHFALAEPAAALSEEQQREAAEEGGRKEMKAAMQEAGNKDLGADKSTDGKTGRAAADSVWDRANANVGRVKKEG